MDIPGYPDRTPDELAAAYVTWLQSDDPSCEWAWEAMHDGICFSFEPLDALNLLLHIAGELEGDARALKLLGAGPLEDLLGGDSATVERALEAAQRSSGFRVALAGVDGIRHAEPGYERLRAAVANELRGDEVEGSTTAG